MSLASVVGLRMFGLFLILPVFAAYARKLPGAAHAMWLVGLAIGIYGFTQMLLQIPMGWLSDHIGRRPAITLGLVVFAAGSVVAAMAHGINGTIIGRALQGAGAVSGASQALAADHSQDDNRNKVMGIIGVGIGLAFVLSMILSAPLAAAGGLQGLFGLTAILALCAIVLLWWLVPAPPTHARTAVPVSKMLRMVANPRLLVLNGSVFCMHGLMTACFVAMPMLLVRDAHISLHDQWILYLPVLLASAVVMGGTLRRVQGLSASMSMVIVCALTLLLSMLAFAAGGHGAWLIWVGAFLFFSAFNLLEATLPGLVSRLAPTHLRGAALGAYASCQFAGAGVGGVLGGIGVQQLGLSGLFFAAAVIALVWLLLLGGGRRLVVAPVASQPS